MLDVLFLLLLEITGVVSAGRERHIACDIGIRGGGYAMQEALGCVLARQDYSRLVIDGNRTPDHEDSFPPVSDGTPVPAGQGVDVTQRRAREQVIFHPDHVHIGLLHDHDLESARIMKDLLAQEGGLCIGDNEPCVLSSGNDFTVSRHAALHEMPALETGIRQDLVADHAGQVEWAARLACVLPLCWGVYQKSRLNGWENPPGWCDRLACESFALATAA